MLAKFLHCFLRALWLEQNLEWPRGSCCQSWWMELEASGGVSQGIGAELSSASTRLEVMKRGTRGLAWMFESL